MTVEFKFTPEQETVRQEILQKLEPSGDAGRKINILLNEFQSTNPQFALKFILLRQKWIAAQLSVWYPTDFNNPHGFSRGAFRSETLPPHDIRFLLPFTEHELLLFGDFVVSLRADLPWANIESGRNVYKYDYGVRNRIFELRHYLVPDTNNPYWNPNNIDLRPSRK